MYKASKISEVLIMINKIIGWKVFEMVGIGIINPKNCYKTPIPEEHKERVGSFLIG